MRVPYRPGLLAGPVFFAPHRVPRPNLFGRVKNVGWACGPRGFLGCNLTKKKETPDRQFATAAAKIAAERHCKDIAILDLRGKSPVTNYFVIATSTSPRQARTVADEISACAKEAGFDRFGQAGYEQGRWILMDFVEVVVHIFDDEYREYYDLEILWGDAKRVRID